ncbi:hypothetical protein F5Y12DRAFT_632003 [Xylaria sp. FL1777]|nr:hypothetical protein F5Y12DRAFT_632003 [Xylaria sp. FL1777]
MPTSYSYLPSWTSLSNTGPPIELDTVKAATHSDLISFLAVAQHYNIDILPNTWQPARGDLGIGGEAYVRQSYVKSDLHLAFRALRVFYNEFADLSNEERISQAFNGMMTEITILSQPLVYESPNVIRLSSISWNVEPDSVWPVLVYAKGTPIRQYLLESCEKPLDLKEKLRICSGICAGVSALHNSGVAHGDLKPHNIIMTKIFQSSDQHPFESSSVAPQIVDVSLSVIGQDTDLRLLPRTVGWSAPEWHDRYFQIQNARRMDIFSFGLICYWILSWDQNFSHLSAEEEDQAMRTLNGGLQGDNNKPHELAIALVRSMNLDISTLENLERLFDLTLAPEPQHRASNASQLLSLLGAAAPSQPGGRDDETPSPNIPLNRCGFRLWHSIAQLTVLDFRVRQFIFSTLSRTSSSTCPECVKNNALQAAICCEIAFGTSRSPDESLQFQRLGEFDQKRLSSEIQALQEYRRSSGPNPLPYFVEPDLVHEYQRRSDIQAACHCLEQEIVGRRFWFSDDHSLVHIMRVSLALVLSEAGRATEALEIQASAVQMCERVYGDSNAETIASLSQLALLLDSCGQHIKAVETGERALELSEKYLAKDDRYVLTTMVNLVVALIHADRLEDAEQLQTDVVKRHEEILGPEHQNTMRCLENQASILDLKPVPDIEAALRIRKRVMMTWEQTHGMQHRDTLRAQYAVQTSISRMNGITAATLDVARDIHDRAKCFLGTEVTDTWLYAANVAMSMIALGFSNEASEVFQEAQSNLERIQGPSHHETLYIMSDYALTCEKAGLYNQAKSICYQIIDRQIGSTETYSRPALNALGILGLSLYGEDKLEEAKEVFEKVLAYSTETWSSKFYTSMARDVATYLQDIYQADGAMEKAIELNQNLVRWANLHNIQDTLEGIKHQINLAGSFVKSSRVKEALEILPDIHQKCLKQFGPHHDVTIGVMTHLISAWNKLGQHEKAIAAGQDLLETLRNTLGPSHEDTLLVMNNIGSMLIEAGSFAEAEVLLLEVANIYALHNNPRGSDRVMHNLAFIYDEQNKVQEAIHQQRKLVLRHVGNTTVDSLEEQYYLALYLSKDPSKLEESLEIAVQVWGSCNDIHGYNNFVTILAAELIGKIHLQQRNLDEAQASFERELRGAADMIQDNKDKWIQHAKNHIDSVLQARLEENKHGSYVQDNIISINASTRQ